MISGMIFLPLGIYDLSTVQYNWLKSIWCCPIRRFIPMRFESLIQIEKSYFWLYLHKGKPPNMNPKASNWNDFYTMTDSVIICIQSFIRCRLYLEMYPIQDFVNLVQGPIICPKVCLPSSSCLVRPGPYCPGPYSSRTGHVQVIYSDFFLEDLIYKWRYLKMFRAT